LRLGLGIGVGALKVTGDMILTESVEQQRLEFNTFAVSMSVAILMEYVNGPFVMRLSGGGPAILGEKHTLQMVESALDVGYVYRF
jgi:hypothetical protein